MFDRPICLRRWVLTSRSSWISFPKVGTSCYFETWRGWFLLKIAFNLFCFCWCLSLSRKEGMNSQFLGSFLVLSCCVILNFKKSFQHFPKKSGKAFVSSVCLSMDCSEINACYLDVVSVVLCGKWYVYCMWFFYCGVQKNSDAL